MTGHPSALHAALFAAVLSLLVGCDSVRAGSVGYANSPLSGRHHTVVRAQDAIGKDGVLWNFHAQARIGTDAQLIGFGTGILRLLGPENARVFPHIATGVTAFEIGRMDKTLAVGIISPYLEFGLNWLWESKEERKSLGNLFGQRCIPSSHWYQTSGLGLSLTGAAQYDVRVTEQPSDFTWRVNLGITRVTRHSPSQRTPRPSDCGGR